MGIGQVAVMCGVGGSNFTVPLDPFGLGSYASQDCGVWGKRYLLQHALGQLGQSHPYIGELLPFLRLAQIHPHFSPLVPAKKSPSFL